MTGVVPRRETQEERLKIGVCGLHRESGRSSAALVVGCPVADHGECHEPAELCLEGGQILDEVRSAAS